MRDLSHDPPDNQSEGTVRHGLTGLFGRDTLGVEFFLDGASLGKSDVSPSTPIP